MRNRHVFELYYVRNDFFSLTSNVPVAAVLRGSDTFEWKQHKLFIQPSPGHTPGCITRVTEVDGRKVAFTGDLIYSPGKVRRSMICSTTTKSTRASISARIDSQS